MKLILSRRGLLEMIPDETPLPPPAHGLVRTRVLYCAVCRTDAKMWSQGHRDLAMPRVPGHEAVVLSPEHQRCVVWPGSSCGTCTFCRQGRENLCDSMKIAGFHTDGGFSDFMDVPEKSLIPIPDGLPSEIACFAEPAGCIVNAFEKISLTSPSRILIIGAGTMGLLAALYAAANGHRPFLIEKSREKIDHISDFLSAAAVPCRPETRESDFDAVISACADHAAFCAGITKAGKGSRISFFSGLTKNERIETNLLNLLHYKEAALTGAYGMTARHMKNALPFLAAEAQKIRLLIEKIVSPHDAPGLMADVISGRPLKYILDFTGSENAGADSAPVKKMESEPFSADKLPGTSLTRQVISNILPVSKNILPAAAAKMDGKTKPLGALGKLESLAIQASRIQETLTPQITRSQILVFAADHGITEEGVSAYPAEVTAQMVDNFLNGGAAINVLCRHHGIGLKIVDMGVNRDFEPHPDLIDKKVARSTANFALQDAMETSQVIQALENGMRAFLEIYEKNPFDIVGLGEMGIGNTTAATAMISCITGETPSDLTGRGTGVDDSGLDRKIEVIEKALAFHRPDPENGLEILQKIGGFEIAGIAGAALAAASKNVMVVLDGVISTAGGLIATLLHPDLKGYLVCGHKSVEPAHIAALQKMSLIPLVDLEFRLGEGTGAAMAIDMADAACRIMCEMASFEEAKVATSHIRQQV